MRWTARAAAAVAAGALGVLGFAAPPATALAATTCSTSAQGDANGDGWTDPVVPVPGKHRNAGQVDLFTGSATGIRPGLSLRAGHDGVPGTDTAGASFGEQVATGDANGDGCADAAILAPDAATPAWQRGVSELGAVTVLYGRPGSGYGTAHAQRITAAALRVPAPTVPGAGDHPLVRRLSAPAFGDFIGRDRTDLALVETTTAVGFGDQASDPSVVRILIVQASASGLIASSGSTLVATAPSLTSGPHGTFAGAAVDLAAGRAHRSYPAALAVVVRGAGRPLTGAAVHGDVTTHGVVDVLEGGSHFPDEGTQVWDRESPGVPGSDAGSDIGHLTAVIGDFDGNGFDDLAFADSGEQGVSVVYGDAGGLSSAGAQTFTAGRGGVPSASGFGRALAAGDFNGDSDDELVVAALDGSITILPGTHAHGVMTLHALHWTQSTTGVPGPREPGSAFGEHLIVGSFGRGLGEDLLVSDPIAAGGAGSVTEFFGARSPNSGLKTTHAALFTESSRGVPGLAIPGDRFGG